MVKGLLFNLSWMFNILNRITCRMFTVKRLIFCEPLWKSQGRGHPEPRRPAHPSPALKPMASPRTWAVYTSRQIQVSLQQMRRNEDGWRWLRSIVELFRFSVDSHHHIVNQGLATTSLLCMRVASTPMGSVAASMQMVAQTKPLGLPRAR